eukprot:364277-Chlamydomonas_euryale.AAC.13
MRPGVATTTCTDPWKRMMSSFSDVPPVVVTTSTLRKNNEARTAHAIEHQKHGCSLKGLHGRHARLAVMTIQNCDSSPPWISFLVGSIFSSTGMQKDAVLPVPFLARARMSRPASAMGMDSS